MRDRLLSPTGSVCRRRFSRWPAHGMSLLEVILALSILAMASAYLAQSMQLATRNALRAERLTQAELVAESVMNQVLAGLISAQPVSWTPYVDSSGQTDWMYQLQSVPTEVEGMLGLQVAVQQLDPNTGLVQSSYDLYANRWIIDPALGLDTPPEETEEPASSTSSGSSGGPSSGSGGGSAATGNSSGGYGGGGLGGGGFGGPPGGGGGRGDRAGGGRGPGGGPGPGGGQGNGPGGRQGGGPGNGPGGRQGGGPGNGPRTGPGTNRSDAGGGNPNRNGPPANGNPFAPR